jgi:cellulose biosynthesis protein BcsQ
MGALMSKIVAFVNMKGGVGKTTVSLSMAEASAAMGKKTLLIDLDLQINASMTVIGNYPNDQLPWKRHNTIEDILENFWQRRSVNISNFTLKFGLTHLLAGSPSITLFERRLLCSSSNFYEARLTADHWMSAILNQALKTYDLVICDTPPGLSLLSEASIRKADLIVIPQAPDQLSTQGIQLYARYLGLDLQLSDIMHRTTVFINKRGHNRVAKDYENAIRADAGRPQFPYKVFENIYGDSVAFKRAMDRSNITEPQRVQFQQLWGPIANEVTAATRELWQFLGWVETDETTDNFSSGTQLSSAIHLI